MGCILLADHNAENRRNVSRVIERLTDHRVEEVGDGLSALARAANADFDLILLEVQLPGLDGFEVCRGVRAEPRTRQIPVLFLTATQYQMESRLRGLEVGADDFIVQPVGEAELIARIKAALRVKALADEVRRHNQELEGNVRERTRTAERLAEQLRAERDTLRETFDVFDQALLLIEVPGPILVANAAGRRLEQTALAPELGALAAEVVKSRTICDRTLAHAGRSFVARGYPMTAQRVVLYVRDVTEERSYEVRRLQSEKLASIGTLAAGVAHEINNPAAFVLGNLESLTSNLRHLDQHVEAIGDAGVRANIGDVLFEIKSVLQETKEGMARIHRIVRDLSTFSHVDDDRGATADLGATVESTLSLLRNELRHRAKVDRDLRSVRVVSASQARIGQVFLNLILNAAQALDEARSAENRILVRTYDRDGESFFEVTDNGPGIPPELHARIFDSFFTTKPRGVGTGLGLPIAHGIVRSLDGEITFETSVGKGTTFRVRMPSRSATRSEPSAAALASLTGPLRRRRILAVDDEPLLLKAYRRMLGDVHDVVTALGGRDALLVLQKETAFDVILCDLQMPEMSGMDLFAKVKAKHPDLAERFVFATGGAFSSQAKQFLEDGVSCIGKPFRVDQLTAVIETKLAEAAERAAVRAHGESAPPTPDETGPERSEEIEAERSEPVVLATSAERSESMHVSAAGGGDRGEGALGPRVEVT